MRRNNSSNSAAGCGIVIIIFLAAAFLSGGGSGAGLGVLSKLFLSAAGIGVVLLLALCAFVIFLAFKGSRDEAEAKEQAQKGTKPEVKPEVRVTQDEALSKARRYLAEERIIAGKLKSEDVRLSTGRVLNIATKITNTLHDKPEKIAKSSQFLNYYLPTLGIILQKYKKVEASGVDISGTREKVISYMGDIERAMQKEYENLFQSDILDLSVEMEAMTIACKRDGLLTDADLEMAYNEQTINLTV